MLIATLTLLGMVSGLALAQDRHNFLAINGDLNDEAGPYYFIAWGDSSNAFMRAGTFASAIGWEVSYDPARRVVVFSHGLREVLIDATSDVAAGLGKRPDTVRYAGGSLDSPMAILVNGVAYVPITPTVAAVGGDSGWHAAARVVTVDVPEPRAGTQLAAPRTGLSNGLSRVALDLPAGQPYQVAVNGHSLALLFPGASAPAYLLGLDDDPNLRSVAFEVMEGMAALVVRTRHDLDANGLGYTVGSVPREGSETVYVDFGPALQGNPATPMADGETQVPISPQLPVLAPVVEAQPMRYSVVIDLGHGGHDPGASRSWAREKDIVLDIGLRLKSLLEAAGVEVIMTRTTDVFLTLEDRSNFATTDRNIFVSIHANSAESSSAQGIETFVFGQPLEAREIQRAIQENGGGDVGAARTAEAANIAADIAGDILRETQLNYSRTLAELVQGHLVRSTGAVDRGVRQNLFFVIRRTRIPAILVELGFVSHPEEGRRLIDPEYQGVLADALATAILEFLRNGGSLAAR